jgi:hypothetical protein
MSPEEAGWLTKNEVLRMLDGIDWANDREWERMVYLRLPAHLADTLRTLSYPHFRTPRVVQVASSDDD